jgi:MFS family permease
MTGLGVGGQFAVGVTLVAETMPDRARPYALGLLQAMASIANVAAALIALGFGRLERSGVLQNDWRWMFAVGVLPALLALVVMWRLKEPEAWQRAVASYEGRRKAGSLGELFGEPRWRHRAIVGLLLASSGVIGLWGIGFFCIDLNRTIFRNQAQKQARDAGEAEQDRQFVRWLVQSSNHLDALTKPISPQDFLAIQQGSNDPQAILTAALELRQLGRPISPAAVLDQLNALGQQQAPESVEMRRRRAQYLAGNPPGAISSAAEVQRIAARTKEINGEVSWWGSITSMLFNGGAFFGIYTFSRVTARVGRRPAFAMAFILAMVSTAGAFLFMKTAADVFWMVPIMGFFQLSLFGGYAIYFPELFPTRLRSTGTSFCYNIARIASAAGPAVLGLLTTEVFTRAHGFDEPMRYAGLSMCSVFILGLLVLPFAPETKGQPLPE